MTTDMPTPPPPVAEAGRTDLERAVLVETLHDPHPQTALDSAEPADFAVGTHRRVWEAMRRVVADGQTLAYDTLTDRMESDGDLLALGGWWPVVELLSPGHQWRAESVWLARRLHERGRRERLAQAGRKVAAMAANGEVDLDAVEAELAPLQQSPDRGISGPWDVRDQLLRRLADPEALEGLRAGWGNLDPLYRVAAGLVTIVTGIPGSGKSTWLDNVLVRMADRHDWRIGVMSPESAPTARHVGRIAGIRCGTHPAHVSRGDLDTALDWIDRHFRWVESTDGLTLAEVLRRADVIRRHFSRLDGLVIDPWNELDHARPDSITETQHISASLSALRTWARRHGTHVWLVAHPKKLDKRVSGQYPPPTLYDISGSSTWHDKADMGVVVHRDKLTPGPVDLHVVKVRFDDNGTIGTAKLVFDQASATYRDAAPEWRQPA